MVEIIVSNPEDCPDCCLVFETCEECRDAITAITATVSGYPDCTYVEGGTGDSIVGVATSLNGTWFCNVSTGTPGEFKQILGTAADVSDRGILISTRTLASNGKVYKTYAYAMIAAFFCPIFGDNAHGDVYPLCQIFNHTDSAFVGFTAIPYPACGWHDVPWYDICAGSDAGDTCSFTIWCDTSYSTTHTLISLS